MNISIHDYQAIAAGKVRRAKREEWRHSRIEALRLPDYTFTEEVLNCATHALGAVLGAVGLLMSLRVLLHAGSMLAMTSMTIFCVTMVMLYTNSALYHGWELTPVKKMFQVLDHCTIFLLIAGTYAPYTLMVMGNAVGKMIFGGVAAACLVGIALNLMDMKKYRVISMVCYLAAGWCIIFAYRWISAALSPVQLALLIGGGVAYTMGAVLYGLGKTVRYMHTVWHLFVLAGSLMHFFSLYGFVLTYFG